MPHLSLWIISKLAHLTHRAHGLQRKPASRVMSQAELTSRGRPGVPVKAHHGRPGWHLAGRTESENWRTQKELLLIRKPGTSTPSRCHSTSAAQKGQVQERGPAHWVPATGPQGPSPLNQLDSGPALGDPGEDRNPRKQNHYNRLEGSTCPLSIQTEQRCRCRPAFSVHIPGPTGGRKQMFAGHLEAPPFAPEPPPGPLYVHEQQVPIRGLARYGLRSGPLRSELFAGADLKT